MEIKGTLLMRYRNKESKSEGWYAYLVTDDMQYYQLYRPDIFPINDSFFYAYDRKDVIITGDVSEDGKYLSVEKLMEFDGIVINKNQENEEVL